MADNAFNVIFASAYVELTFVDCVAVNCLLAAVFAPLTPQTILMQF